MMNLVGTAMAVVSSIYNMLTMTKHKPAIKVLSAYGPLILWMLTLYIMMNYTEWAWENVSLTFLLAAPMISLANCR